jgi:hypothetical protein
MKVNTYVANVGMNIMFYMSFYYRRIFVNITKSSLLVV